MIKTIKKLLTSLSLAAMVFVPMAPVVVSAQATDAISGNLCSGANLDASKLGQPSAASCKNDPGAARRIDEIIKLVINVFSLIVGVVAVIMIIIGGLKYITSGGDSGNITGAKNTILYAIIGLVVVALAQVVVRFVLSKTVA